MFYQQQKSIDENHSHGIDKLVSVNHMPPDCPGKRNFGYWIWCQSRREFMSLGMDMRLLMSSRGMIFMEASNFKNWLCWFPFCTYILSFKKF